MKGGEFVIRIWRLSASQEFCSVGYLDKNELNYIYETRSSHGHDDSQCCLPHNTMRSGRLVSTFLTQATELPRSSEMRIGCVVTRNIFFVTPVYLQSVQNTISKWEETETNGEEESSVAHIHMEEAQGLEW
jgi:hypothetical protein